MACARLLNWSDQRGPSRAGYVLNWGDQGDTPIRLWGDFEACDDFNIFADLGPHPEDEDDVFIYGISSRS